MVGILGPVIRAEVGDEIIVDFLNRSHSPHSMHPHGVRYDKNSEGSFYEPFGKGDRVAPGAKYTYHWFANATSGPGPNQPSSIVWWYHSHVDPQKEINAGLMGPLIITAKGKANADGSPKDVDDEFVAFFMVFDQMEGKTEGFFYAINGLIFGNLPGLIMKKNDKVRWHLVALGNEIDLHTPHWHGETVTDQGRNIDLVELLPGSMKTVDMVADNPGTWMFHCHVDDHMEGGMMAAFTIYTPPTRSCPVAFSDGDFWQHPDKLSISVKNTGDKPIKNLQLSPETFIAPQYLQRPYNLQWNSDTPIAPGQEIKLEHPGSGPSGQNLFGWVFFPSLITYADGTKWRPEFEGECFDVFWRDPTHAKIPALPPRQIELNDD